MTLSPLALIFALVAGPTQQLQTLTKTVKAETLKAHVTYLASDALEGRDTPSKGLDQAADYIAAEFKKAKIKPGNKDSYFQVTEFGRKDQPKKPVRNVIGLIEGTDPKLKDTYVLVTAHYDHLGSGGQGEDKIFNGANDNASGVAGVIEIGRALAANPPRRSVVVMCFWGEELNLRGAAYYIQNPVIPLAKTIANINLEQIGRTDDSEAPRVSAMAMTGFDFSDLGTTLADASKPAGVPVTKHPKYSDPFFMFSDNAVFAAKGIPCGTLSAAFDFPDYHQVGDSADKLDYVNMQKLVVALVLGTAKVANSAEVPKWNESLPRVQRYIEAQKALLNPKPKG